MTTLRVRNHELEELSLAALRFALPPKWVIHDFRRDYGIDVQLEIFEDDGRATGLRCYGQLKATDKPGDDDALALDRDHFEYWTAHSDPVLLLRYYADSKQFSWCWLHDVAWSLKPGAQTLSVVKFLKRWNDKEAPQKVKGFLTQRSRAFTERLCPPFKVAIAGDSAAIGRLADIASKAHNLVNPGVFRFLAGSIAGASFVITVTADGLMSTHLGLPGFAVDGVESESEDEFVALVLLLVFLTACRYDRILAARPLAKSRFDLFLKSAGDALFFPLIDSMVYAIGLEETHKLADTAGVEKLHAHGSMLLAGAAYVAAHRYGEAAHWISLVRSALKLEKTSDQSGTLAYNLGNALSNNGDWEEALSMFRRAAKDESSYLDRGYFRHEYAAVLFENGLFAEAAEHYRAALKLTPSARLHFLLGDVLYCAGEFSAALEELTHGLAGGLTAGSQAFALLLRELCAEMIDGWNVNHIEPFASDDGGIAILQALTDGELQDLPVSMRPLVLKYGADGLFNFNAGHIAISNGHARLAAYRYLHCAMRQRWDSEAWALAISCAMSTGDDHLFTLGIVAGYFYVGESLLISFFKCCQSPEMDDAALEEWRRSFSELVHGTVDMHEVKSLTVRLHGPDKSLVLDLPQYPKP